MSLPLNYLWLFPFLLHIPFHSIFHYHYLIFTLSTSLLLSHESLHLCLSVHYHIPSLVPSILSLLSLYLSLEILPLLAFLKTSVLSKLSSPVQISLPQYLPSFLRNSFRILFVVPPEAQTPEGGKPKHFSKLSSDVVLWECEWHNLKSQPILWNQRLCTCTFVTSVSVFFFASFSN